LELLRQAPNLVKCSFERMCPVHNLDPTAEKLVHPTLRRLMFAESNDNDILHCLSLPALKTISLSLSETSIGDFIYFLSRSSPLLEELTVVTGASLDSVRLRLYECLRIVPTVARFEIWWPGSRLLEGLFNGLADSSSPVLPNLHSLIIHLHVYAVSDSSWKTLLGVLSARRTQLQIIHIKYSETVSQRPAPDVFAAFRELVASGMQVHIGTEAYNWLSV
jgi:hypothetical protein